MDIINSKGHNIGRSDGAPAVGRSMDVTSRNKQLGATRQVKRPTSPRAPYSSGLLPVQGACGVLLEHHTLVEAGCLVYRRANVVETYGKCESTGSSQLRSWKSDIYISRWAAMPVFEQIRQCSRPGVLPNT